MSVKLGSYLKAWVKIHFQVYSDCCKNSVPRCRAEVPLFFLAVNHRELSASRDPSVLLLTCLPSHMSTSHMSAFIFNPG